MSFFAPQAYTKETLSKAFDWLQYQPATIKQAATSPDVLVSLYLKAQRNGIDHIDVDAPISSKKFIDDLKLLKKDIAQFDSSQNMEPSPAPKATPPEVTAKASLASSSPSHLSPVTMMNLDKSSLEAVQAIQTRFNLSSPQEALRMIISVGCEHISRWN